MEVDTYMDEAEEVVAAQYEMEIDRLAKENDTMAAELVNNGIRPIAKEPEWKSHPSPSLDPSTPLSPLTALTVEYKTLVQQLTNGAYAKVDPACDQKIAEYISDGWVEQHWADHVVLPEGAKRPEFWRVVTLKRDIPPPLPTPPQTWTEEKKGATSEPLTGAVVKEGETETVIEFPTPAPAAQTAPHSNEALYRYQRAKLARKPLIDPLPPGESLLLEAKHRKPLSEVTYEEVWRAKFRIYSNEERELVANLAYLRAVWPETNPRINENNELEIDYGNLHESLAERARLPRPDFPDFAGDDEGGEHPTPGYRIVEPAHGDAVLAGEGRPGQRPNDGDQVGVGFNRAGVSAECQAD